MQERKHAKVIKKTLILEYSCGDSNKLNHIKLTDFRIGEDQYFEDWTYTYINFKCPICGENHTFEI